MKKKNNYGKNFIINKTLINSFIDIIKPNNNDILLEIGTGYGAITNNIIDKVKKIVLVEFDRKIYNFLLKVYKNNKNVFIINSDARNINISNLFLNKKNNKYRIFGSIPYYASKKIISNLHKYINNIIDIHFIVQKEMSEKITYNSVLNNRISKFGLINKLFFNTKIILNNISPKNFSPLPKVYSSIIKMYPNYKYKNIIFNEINLYKIIKTIKIIFNKKRKILKNVIPKNLINKIDFNKFNIDLYKRPQNISIEEYFILSKYI